MSVVAKPEKFYNFYKSSTISTKVLQFLLKFYKVLQKLDKFGDSQSASKNWNGVLISPDDFSLRAGGWGLGKSLP